jgi:hypothetical protein
MPPIPPPPSVELDQAIDDLLEELEAFLPAPAPPLPDPSVFLVSMTERSVGLGGTRGLERRGAFGVVELRGVRVDAVVRFQLWGADAAAAATAGRTLEAALAANRDSLWTRHFLRIALSDASFPAPAPGGGAFGVVVEYRVLYEHPIQDTGGAQSLIARIPVESDPEERESLARETTTVTDELVRWDDLGAAPLVVRGPRAVARLASLDFVAGPQPTGAVTLTRTFDGAPPPTAFPSLAAFHDAVAGTDPPERNGRVAFVSPADLFAALTPLGPPLGLGDWNLDGVLDAYQARELVLDPPIVLPRAADRLELEHANPALDQMAVVYLRFAGPSA